MASTQPANPVVRMAGSGSGRICEKLFSETVHEWPKQLFSRNHLVRNHLPGMWVQLHQKLELGKASGLDSWEAVPSSLFQPDLGPGFFTSGFQKIAVNNMEIMGSTRRPTTPTNVGRVWFFWILGSSWSSPGAPGNRGRAGEPGCLHGLGGGVQGHLQGRHGHCEQPIWHLVQNTDVTSTLKRV